MIPQKCGKLTIFEGPDGSGKTTVAGTFADKSRARIVHHGAYPDCFRGINGIYNDSMTRADDGRDLVLDRCWISEKPYGSIHRPYEPLRVHVADQRMLERRALRYGAVIVRCLPDKSRVLKTWAKRKDIEEVDTQIKMSKIYDWYAREFTTSLTIISYDYWNVELPSLYRAIERRRPIKKHFTNVCSAGNADASVVLVSSRQKSMPVWVDFEPLSLSQWLAQYLEAHNIPESALCWLTVDAENYDGYDGPWLRTLTNSGASVIALDSLAERWLCNKQIPAITIEHPAHPRKRVNGFDDYELAAEIKKYIMEEI